MAVVDFNEKAAQRYLKQAIAQFAADPPDTDFQRGYLEALLTVQHEAFNPRANATPSSGSEG
jgi:hypothetical protein